MNRNEWAALECQTMGWPDTIVPAIVAQCLGESTGARYNPQATEMVMPGSTPYNPQGVQNYPDTATGLAAMKKTWLDGFYPTVDAAGKQGDPNQWVVAVANSPYGTWSSVAEAQADLSTVMHDPTIGEVEVAGTQPAQEDDMPITATGPAADNQRHLYRENADGTVDHWHQDTAGPQAGVWVGPERLPGS
jgi:hypothetical protein